MKGRGTARHIRISINASSALLVLVFILSIAANDALAQSEQARPTLVELPTVDQVLAKYVSAIGGSVAIEKIKSLSARGSISLPAIRRDGVVEIYRAAPDKYLFSATITGLGITQECFDGKIGWSWSPHTGVRLLAGAELAQAKREADIYQPLHLKGTYASMSVKGVEKVGERDALVIDGVVADGSHERLYFDQASGLLVRIDEATYSPLGTEPMQVYYEDYREVSGIKIPFKRRQVTPGITTVVTLEEVQGNAQIDASKFRKPRNVD